MAGKNLTIGNLGEQVCGRLLTALGYQILGTQDDFAGGGFISDVVGEYTPMNAEDFIAISPDGRLMTVNSKASARPRACRITRSGDLTRPRLGHGQSEVQYSSRRAELISELDGDSYAQVVKVDLVHLQAQIFEVGEDGRMTTASRPHDVADIVSVVLSEFAELTSVGSLDDIMGARGRIDTNAGRLDIADPMGRPRDDFKRVYREIAPEVRAVVTWANDVRAHGNNSLT